MSRDVFKVIKKAEDIVAELERAQLTSLKDIDGLYAKAERLLDATEKISTTVGGIVSTINGWLQRFQRFLADSCVKIASSVTAVGDTRVGQLQREAFETKEAIYRAARIATKLKDIFE